MFKVGFVRFSRCIRSLTEMAKRVVVTGLGAVTPLGAHAQNSWRNLIASHCGIVNLSQKVHEPTGTAFAGLPSLVAGVVPKGINEGEWDISSILTESVCVSTLYSSLKVCKEQ